MKISDTMDIAREEMSVNAGGMVLIDTPEALRKVLTHHGTNLSTTSFDFRAQEWRQIEAADRDALFAFLEEAVDKVCTSGLLPFPKEPLPPLGCQVEAMIVGGKPGPRSKYGTGKVTGYSWDSVFHTWRLGVAFDEPAGYYYGNPITGTSTFPSMVRVVGGSERLFSDMTPAEIEALYLEVRLKF